MTIEKLIEKAREFEKKNERITWKPNDFPEDKWNVVIKRNY